MYFFKLYFSRKPSEILRRKYSPSRPRVRQRYFFCHRPYFPVLLSSNPNLPCPPPHRYLFQFCVPLPPPPLLYSCFNMHASALVQSEYFFQSSTQPSIFSLFLSLSLSFFGPRQPCTRLCCGPNMKLFSSFFLLRKNLRGRPEYCGVFHPPTTTVSILGLKY